MSWQVDKPILVPFDFSDHSVAALRKALNIAESPALVHAVHVLPFMIPTEPGVVWATVDDASRLEHAQEAMGKSMAEHKFGDVVTDVRLGDPGQVVADLADSLDASLVVVGSHGRTGLSRLVLGSVAERVTRLAHCAVLVVKLPE